MQNVDHRNNTSSIRVEYAFQLNEKGSFCHVLKRLMKKGINFVLNKIYNNPFRVNKARILSQAQRESKGLILFSYNILKGWLVNKLEKQIFQQYLFEETSTKSPSNLQWTFNAVIHQGTWIIWMFTFYSLNFL